jgi:chaperonin GroEL
VWATKTHFSIIGGEGNPKAVRQRAQQIRKSIPTLENDYERQKAMERVGTLSGGTAILWVGAPIEIARVEKKVRAESAVATLRAALEEGCVPGGGAAYLACAKALRSRASSADGVAAGVLARALEEPMRCIARNAGYDPRAVLARVQEEPSGWGFDAVKGRIVSMAEAGIVDPAKVARIALETGISAAMTALTTDVLIHRPHSPRYH